MSLTLNSVKAAKKLEEYPFQNEDEMEEFIHKNPFLLDPSLQIIAKQPTDDIDRPDLIGIGFNNQLVIIEEKLVADEDALPQLDKYVRWVNRHPDWVKSKFEMKRIPCPSASALPKQIIIAEKISDSLLEASTYPRIENRSFYEIRRFRYNDDVLALLQGKLPPTEIKKPVRTREHSWETVLSKGYTNDKMLDLARQIESVVNSELAKLKEKMLEPKFRPYDLVFKPIKPHKAEEYYVIGIYPIKRCVQFWVYLGDKGKALEPLGLAKSSRFSRSKYKGWWVLDVDGPSHIKKVARIVKETIKVNRKMMMA